VTAPPDRVPAVADRRAASDRVSAAAARLAEARATLPPGAIELACHAAVPVAVDPTLLNLLRVNFFVDPPYDLPWPVEAALLTSPLFKELGGDLYEIDDDLRRQLLISLRTTYGPDRAVQVALLLERYCDRPGVWSAHPSLEQAQQLTAIGIIDPPAAQRWLEEAAEDAGAQVGLSKEWFVAMGGRLDRRPDPELRLGAETEEAVGLLPDDAAVRRLAELGLLPGADLALIRNALRSVRTDPATAALALLDPLSGPPQPPPDDDGPLPLTDLLRDTPMWEDHRGGRLVPVPFGIDWDGRSVTVAQLDLVAHGRHGRVVAPVGTGRREFLRTVVLAFAAVHPPHELELLLIDAAGVGTFTGLDLPHTVGIITGPLTPIGADRLADDVLRELRGRGTRPAPNLLVVIDDYLDLPERPGLVAGLLDADDAGVHVLLAARSHDVILQGVRDRRGRGYEVELGAATAGQPGVGVLRLAGGSSERFAAAATFVPHAPGSAETVAERLVATMSARAAPRPWIAVPVPVRQPQLLDLLGPRRVVPSRGLTTDSTARWSRTVGLAGVVGRKDAPGYEPFELDLSRGNVAIVGSPYTGRVDVLIALVLSLALTNTPDEVQFVLLDRNGGLAPLAALPHVFLMADDADEDARTDALRQVRQDGLVSGDRHVFVVVNRRRPAGADGMHLSEIAALGSAPGVHVLISADAWDEAGVLESFATRLETKLDDPSTSRIDPARAADLLRESLDCGLAPNGEHFVVGLIAESRTHNARAAAALAASIAAHWQGAPVQPADYYFISHVRDDPRSVAYARALHREVGAVVRRELGLGDDVPVGLAAFELPSTLTTATRLVHTLSVCQAFISVESAGYMHSATCAREWNLFRVRAHAGAAITVVNGFVMERAEVGSAEFGRLVQQIAEKVVTNVRQSTVQREPKPRGYGEVPESFLLRKPRFALVIGTSRFDDRTLGDLPLVRQDAAEIAEALGDPLIGRFVVTTVLDGRVQDIQEAIVDFLAGRSSDDEVVIYLAGHALPDGGGPLLAGADTTSARPWLTGIAVDWLSRQLNSCQARQQVVIMELCLALDDRGFQGGVDAVGVNRAWLIGSYTRGHGAPTFTRLLLRSMRDGAREGFGDESGRITVDAAFQHALPWHRGGRSGRPTKRVAGDAGHLPLTVERR
jgi:S-DNA-T family DNA segregation ATPase FtsK/SpoIIIE